MIEWQDRLDKWSDKITDAHPLFTNNHDAYIMAMEMVGNRHSKGALVNLVCWLIQEAKLDGK